MDNYKLLTSKEIEELKRLHLVVTQDMINFPERAPHYYEHFCALMFDAMPILLSKLTPPPDAAVRQALAERGLRRYYQTAFDDGYVPRVMPYVWRIIWTVGGLMAVTAVLPTNTGRPAFDALVVFSTWYPIGVMLLVFASRPLGRLIRQRAQERRK